MAITDGENGSGMVMPVQPMGSGYQQPPMYYPAYGYGGGNNDSGFNGDESWLILFIILAMSGNWGGFGGGGFGGGMGAVGAAGVMDSMMMWPWLMAQSVDMDVQGGFNQAATQAAITGVQNAVTSGFGDTALGIAGINQNICQSGNNTVTAITAAQNALAQQMYGNQLANLERSFAAQTANSQGLTALQAQLAQCCCDNQLATNSLGADIAREACADRQAVSEALMNVTAQGVANTNALMTTINGGIQSIKDQLCQDKIDEKNDTIAQLRQEVLYARGQASQDVQTARILAGQTSEVDALYNRLSTCPVNTVPVYGSQPIFTCPNNGCGCGNGF